MQNLLVKLHISDLKDAQYLIMNFKPSYLCHNDALS